MTVLSTRLTVGLAVALCVAGFVLPTKAEAVCHYDNGELYTCPKGFYCCDNKNCCKPHAHLYKTQWFWLVWAGVIIAAGCCACVYKHKRCRSSRYVCCSRQSATEPDEDVDPLAEEGSDELGDPVSVDHPFLLPPEERLVDKPPSYFDVVAQEQTEEERRTLRALLARPVRARAFSNEDMRPRSTCVRAHRIPNDELLAQPVQAHIISNEEFPVEPVRAEHISNEETHPARAHSAADSTTESAEGSSEDLPLLSSNPPVDSYTS